MNRIMECSTNHGTGSWLTQRSDKCKKSFIYGYREKVLYCKNINGRNGKDIIYNEKDK